MKSNASSSSSSTGKNGDGYDDGTVSFGRFREFTSVGGDAEMQNDLVLEVLRQATHISTSESMESTIQTHLDAASEILSDMYSKGEREIEERNHRLAIQASLPEISKWNKQLIDGNKASRQHRMEISKELALVDALLKRTARAKRNRNSKSSRSRRRRSSTTNNDNNATNNNLDLSQNDKQLHQRSSNSRHNDSRMSLNESLRNSEKKRTLANSSPSISTPSAFLFTAVVCTVALESFDSITSREGGAARLADYAAVSALLMLSLAYLNALRTALLRAQDDLRRYTGSTTRPPSDRR